MVYFKFGVLVFCAVFTQISAQTRILKEAPHYTIREFNGELPELKLVSGVSYKLTEIVPTNVTVPEDYGGNFGDMDFEMYEGGHLVARDTILTEKYNTTVQVNYRRQKVGYNATAINILNFGRERGWAFRGGLWHLDGIWESTIWVAPNTEIRMFVECYGVPLN